MATDATGTPTTKGIPKYDTTNDAPSGLGFNAAMDAIDTLLGWVKLRKNSTGTIYSRGRMNLIEGSGISITVADDSTDNEVDVTVATSGGGVPAGSLVAYGGAAAPSGWLLCDGSAVSRATYSDLFAAINVAYGAGDGSNTFNVPDMRGRVPVGKGSHTAVDALGDNDGSAEANRQPGHRHTVTDPGHTHTSTGHLMNGNQSGGGTAAGGVGTTTPTNSGSTGITIATAGASAPLDTPAYLVHNYIIKT